MAVDLVAKKYRVLKSLGQGAMGEVFLVLPPKGEPVALKLLKTLEATANSQAIEQFENEFKTLKRLSHPNIGRIFDYGFDEDLKKVFFTLPWLQGTDIYNATKDMGFEQCEDICVQTLRALNYLHQKGLFHCDLKPGNIYIEDGQALIIDFGLAGYWGENIVGTPTYLAPEVFRGVKHNAASDLYAAGVIFYNCLTRSQPYSGKTLQEVYDRHRSFTPPPISEINNKVPKYFSDIVATLLNKKPEERYPSATAVIEEIDAYSMSSYSVETEATLLSYLPTEADITVDADVIEDIRTALKDFKSDHIKENYHLILVHGQKNVGKTRMVAKIKNELQLAKITVESISTPLTDQEKSVVLANRALILEGLDSFFMSASEMVNFKQVLNLIEQKILATTAQRFMLIVSSTREKDFDTIKKLFPSEETKITTIGLNPYNFEQTRDFLVHIIGQKEIPEKFTKQFFQNTEGLPGVALQLIQSLIENGLLFDKSGRWNEDLLSNLDKAFDSIQVSASLEQEFERLYDGLSDDEEQLTKWLAVCPHPLHINQLQQLTQLANLNAVLATMCERKIIREENKNYTLFRSVFQNFISSNLPETELRKCHSQLANPRVGLDKKQAIYHLSQGENKEMRLKARVKLAKIYVEDGDREHALQEYQKLIAEFRDSPFQERIDWYIEAGSLQIWLDRFKEAHDLISEIEKEIQRDKPTVDHLKFMILLEKKGVAYLHMQNMDKARLYFENGLKYSLKFGDCGVQQIRFENNLAEIEFMQGHQDKAIDIFKKTRDISKNMSNVEKENITNNDLGHVYLSLQKYTECQNFLIEDIKIFSGLKNREPLARALYSFAELMRVKEHFDKSIEAYEECINICKIGHYYPLLLRTYNGLGNLYLTRSENQQALKSYQKAIDIAVRLKEETSKAALLYNQGYIYRKEQNTAQAARRYLMAKQVLENKGTRLAYEETLLSRCYNELSSLAVEDKNTIKALSYQLERLKFVQESATLHGEKFPVKLNLAELYLENRLKEQFDNEIKSLESMAKDAEELERINHLKTKWLEIEGNTDQDATGRLQVM